MPDNPLPKFDDLEARVQFFDTHDMGEYDLPEVHFDVDITKRTYLVSVDKDLLTKLSHRANKEHVTTEELVNTWLKERAALAERAERPIQGN